MKRTLMLVATGLMALTLVGCNDNNAPKKPDVTPVTANEPVIVEPATETLPATPAEMAPAAPTAPAEPAPEASTTDNEHKSVE